MKKTGAERPLVPAGTTTRATATTTTTTTTAATTATTTTTETPVHATKWASLVQAISDRNVQRVAQALREDGSLVRQVDAQGMTLLAHAVRMDCAGVAALLLEHGADATAAIEQPRCAATDAFAVAARGFAAVTVAREELIGSIATICDPNVPIGRHALTLAIESNASESVVVALAGARKDAINALDGRGHSALIVAIQGLLEWTPPASGEARIRLLEKCGADLNQTDARHRTPLALAARAGQLAVVKLLIDLGASADVPQGNEAWSPLALACLNDHAVVIPALLQALPDTSRRDAHVCAALKLACGAGGPAAVTCLLSKARTSIGPDAVVDALSLALGGGHATTATALLKNAGVGTQPVAQWMRWLTAASSSGVPAALAVVWEASRVLVLKNQRAKNDALMLAAGVGLVAIVDELLQAGASPQATHSQLGSALVMAAGHGHVQVIKRLLVHGAKVDQGTDRGTALMAAARCGEAAAVTALLHAGAGLCIEWSATHPEPTALSEAVLRGHVGVVRLLLAAGGEALAPQVAWLVKIAADAGHDGTLDALLASLPNSLQACARALARVSTPNGVRLLLQRGSVPEKALREAINQACVDGRVEVASALLETNIGSTLRAQDVDAIDAQVRTECLLSGMPVSARSGVFDLLHAWRASRGMPILPQT